MPFSVSTPHLSGFGGLQFFVQTSCHQLKCSANKMGAFWMKEFETGMKPDEVLREVIRKQDALREKETEEVQHTENLTFIQGRAKFSGPKTLEIKNGEIIIRVSADNIVIATGAHPRWLDIPGLPKERTLTNESLFDLTDAPKHLAIVGAGIIALEMGFAFQKLGIQVTMFALDDRPLTTAIPEAAEVIQAALDRRGITTYYNATAKSYDETSRTLTLQSGDNEIEVRAVDKVLIAIGRVRNINSLGLEQAGVQYDRGGVKVNSFAETSVKGVYAIGDVTPTSAFTHSANAQGRRVVQRIAFPLLPISKKEPLYPSATFSDPEVATVGLDASTTESAVPPRSGHPPESRPDGTHRPRLHRRFEGRLHYRGCSAPYRANLACHDRGAARF